MQYVWDKFWVNNHAHILQGKGGVSTEHIMLAIRLPAEVETRLDNLAKATGRTKTFYAREAILEHLDAFDGRNGDRVHRWDW